MLIFQTSSCLMFTGISDTTTDFGAQLFSDQLTTVTGAAPNITRDLLNISVSQMATEGGGGAGGR